MIIKYYKGFVSLERLKDMLYITKDGTTAYNIVLASQELGFKADCYQLGFSSFQENKIIFPCIANVVINGKYKHFVVIYEINYDKKYLIIGDPASSLKKIKFDEFEKIFTGYIIMLYPIKPIPIMEKDKIDYKYFLKIILNDKKLIIKIILLSLFITIASIISSFYIEFLITSIDNTSSTKNLYLIFLIFFIIYIFKNICEFFRSKVLIIINQKIDIYLTMDTYYNILSLPYHYYRNKTTGDMVSRINDLGNLKDIISKVLIILIVDLPLTLISLIFLLFISKILFLIALIILIFYFFIILIFKKVLESNIYSIQQEKSNLTSKMVESISGFETIKGLKIKKYIFENFKKSYYIFLKRLFHFQNIYLLENFLKNLVNDLGFVIICFIGSVLVLNNEITLGNLLTFNALIIYFLEPIKNIISLDVDKTQAKCSIKRIIELNQKEKEEDIKNEPLKGLIEYKNLSYSFNYDKKILKNINLRINQGEKVLFLGPSGSGKSTMLKMLMKYYPINNGKLFIDGKDVNKICNSSNIKYINQIETLFTDTLYNNLLLGKVIDEEKLNKIIEICCLDEIIKKDTLGIDQIIEENGFNLSGGERQRIVLARTLLQDFDILIIDEGLNQVDIKLEREILKRVMKEYKDKTIIVISHRLNNKNLYQKIISLKDGVIV